MQGQAERPNIALQESPAGALTRFGRWVIGYDGKQMGLLRRIDILEVNGVESRVIDGLRDDVAEALNRKKRAALGGGPSIAESLEEGIAKRLTELEKRLLRGNH